MLKPSNIGSSNRQLPLKIVNWPQLDIYTLACCNNAVPASVCCKNDKFANLTAPPGFQNYKWFNTVNIVLGNEQVLHLTPLPHAGDTLYVQLTPFNVMAV